MCQNMSNTAQEEEEVNLTLHKTWLKLEAKNMAQTTNVAE